ncbi:MAG TPA: dienelactone hydrolase family protein [Candidatus Binataceae bacterium]
MSGKSITIAAPGGDKFSGYLATPPSGSGPGLLVLQEIFGVNRHIREVTDRWAEEGYVALAPDLFWRAEPGMQLDYTPEGMQKGRALRQKLDLDLTLKDIGAALAALRARPECQGKAGVVGYCFGGLLAYLTAARTEVDAAISYYGGGIETRLEEARAIKCPIMFHYGEKDAAIPAAARESTRQALAGHDDAEFYVYRDAQHGFNCNLRASFHPFASQLAGSRSIGLLRRTMGPHYDLSALWDQHCVDEFEIRDADATMTTMIAEPYVVHIPTLTGGRGYKDLRHFYKYHFTNRLPKDVKVVPVSRTVGSNRVVDELLLCFTHDIEIDFMLPGVKPTGKYVEVPHVVVVEFHGDKLACEHIYWDQASALVQLGALERADLPVLGDEAARSLKGEQIPFNKLLPTRKDDSAGKH